MNHSIETKSPHIISTSHHDYTDVATPLLDERTLNAKSRLVVARYIAGKFNPEDLTAAILPHKTNFPQ